jgi:tRNA 2-selenouridine synthase
MTISQPVNEFLKAAEKLLLIDARSEAEFVQGHISGAHNVPLLNNEERKKVGTIYKQEGREKAVEAGFDLVGPKFGELIRTVAKMAPTKEVAVYCWRGGMRSNIVCWILNLYGYKTHVLKGGYKAYRRRVLSEFDKKMELVVVGGKTGSGKTELLLKLEEQGEQVINLEKLANHKGSAFGMIGMPAQPTNEQFENNLFTEINRFDKGKKIWIENESRMIGKIKIPDSLYTQIRSSLVFETELRDDQRIERITNEYGKLPVDQLIECTKRLEKKLGNKRMQEAVAFLEEKNFVKWIEGILEYYDKTYFYGMSLREPHLVKRIPITPDDYAENARSLIKFSQNVNLESPVNL